MTEFARAAALTIIAGARRAERMNAYVSAMHRALTGRPRLCGRAGRTAAGTGRKAHAKRPRWTGRSRSRRAPLRGH